jgi:hypothetical protein
LKIGTKIGTRRQREIELVVADLIWPDEYKPDDWRSRVRAALAKYEEIR